MRTSPPDGPTAGPSGPTKVMASLFGIAGFAHFVMPKMFEAIVPRWAPKPRALVYLSGAVELACSVGLATEQSWAGPASAGLLLAVWPANIKMAIDDSRAHSAVLRQLILWARVPLQLPMIKAALGARRS